VQAAIVPVNGLFFSQSTQIAQLALAARLPTVAVDRHYVEAGLLASYGVDQRESYRRGASYVNRILKGAKPVSVRHRAHKLLVSSPSCKKV
jgi:putative ABC transport system substrate-binding protein